MDIDNIASILKCPITGKKLTQLSEIGVVKLNQAIKRGEFYLGDGQLAQTLHEGFLKVEGEAIYFPIHQDILCLLPDFAIVQTFDHPGIEHNRLDENIKKEIQSFYDQIGWQPSDSVAQQFQDASDSEDLRSVTRDYIQQCHERLRRYLPSKGKYLLDAASGPIQYPVYLTYSQQYDYRICADMSLTGLLKAREKLGDRGIYLLCDITRLPLQADQIDAIISLHTIYHVPEQQQSKAFDELYRVLKPGGKSIIVYSWGKHAALMNLFMYPFKLIKRLVQKMRGQSQPLYFHAHPYQWVKKQVLSRYPTKLYVWRSTNVPFLKVYIHRWLGGKYILKVIYYLEEKCPRLMGRFGAYPMFVTEKK